MLLHVISFLEFQEYYKLRLQTLQQLKDNAENPYPHKFHVSISLEEYIAKFDNLKDGDIIEGEKYSIAGANIKQIGIGKHDM
jgi:lysyl-tRNA synthetase class II